MIREVIENLTVENDEYICEITKKEITDTNAEPQIVRFFDKIKIRSEAFIDICQKIMPIAGAYIQQPQMQHMQEAPIIPFSATNPEMYIHQGQAPTQTIQNNGLPTPKKVNVFEVKEEGNGITAIVQVNKAEQEAQELERAKAMLDRKNERGEPTGDELLKKMAKDFQALTEDDLPADKKKALEEKKKKFPSFFGEKSGKK